MFSTWRRSLVKRSTSSSFRPSIEALEERALLTVSHLAIVATTNTDMVGSSAAITVSAVDSDGQADPNFTGTVYFTSSDGFAALPSPYTFTLADQGSHTFLIPFATLGTQTITVTEAGDSSLSATTSLQVIEQPTTQFSVATSTSSSTAGSSFSVTVTALNASGNIISNYLGTVQLTSSDPNAVLPSAYTFTSADGGVHTFTVNLLTAGQQTITATDVVDPTVTGSAAVAVSPASLAALSVSSSAIASPGINNSITVSAVDSYGNVISGYTGTVHFTSSDSAATLPADYTFTSGDNGSHTFTVALSTPGDQTITATDASNSSLQGSKTIHVSFPTANQSFVNQVYVDLLDRPADSSGMTYWTNFLNQGGTQLAMVESIETSTEFENDIIQYLYEKVLGRSADSAGLSYYQSFMAQGGTITQVEASLLNSQEFFNNRGAGTDTGFLSALYQTVLGRAVDSAGETYFMSELGQGVSVSTVVGQVLNGQESLVDTVELFYQHFLGRSADVNGLSYWVNALQGGSSQEQVIAGILASNEYFANA